MKVLFVMTHCADKPMKPVRPPPLPFTHRLMTAIYFLKLSRGFCVHLLCLSSTSMHAAQGQSHVSRLHPCITACCAVQCQARRGQAIGFLSKLSNLPKVNQSTVASYPCTEDKQNKQNPGMARVWDAFYYSLNLLS